MIDFHSHILPLVDDGSQSVEESLQLLTELSNQGIRRVAATPHFLPDREEVAEFLHRRDGSFAVLQEAIVGKVVPFVHVGAEVSYYEGISKLSELTSLRISQSDLLLLEMPMAKWSDYAIREVMELSCLAQTQLVLAHVERYRSFQRKEVWEELLESGILMQVNAKYFLDFPSRRKAMAQLQRNEIHLLGSDCHNLTTRPPRIGFAYDSISRKLGEEFVRSMFEFGNSLFNNSVE